jgi:hypothetical protein
MPLSINNPAIDSLVKFPPVPSDTNSVGEGTVIAVPSASEIRALRIPEGKLAGVGSGGTYGKSIAEGNAYDRRCFGFLELCGSLVW